MPELWKYRFLYIAAIIVLFALDQATKLWAIMVLGHHNTILPVINGYLELNITYNDGAAWGILSGKAQWLAVMSTVMIIVILTVLGKTNLKDRLLGWALTFQVSGAFGNLYDRLSSRPGVVDFLDAHIPWGGGEGGFWYSMFGKMGLTSAQNYVAQFDPLYNYPIFNLADIWVVIGTVLLLVYIIRMPPDTEPEKVPESTPAEEIPELVTVQPVNNPPSENKYEGAEGEDDTSQ